MIVGVAIHGETYFLSLSKPARHHHVIRGLAADGVPTPIWGEQGFVTDKGVFLTRKQAAAHAIVCGQIEELTTPPYLYSEDLW